MCVCAGVVKPRQCLELCASGSDSFEGFEWGNKSFQERTCVNCSSFAGPHWEVWPPEKGSQFNTSILSWSFDDGAFWRGKAVAMSEVVNYARSIASTRFREAHGVGGSAAQFKRPWVDTQWRCNQKTL